MSVFSWNCFYSTSTFQYIHFLNRKITTVLKFQFADFKNFSPEITSPARLAVKLAATTKILQCRGKKS